MPDLNPVLVKELRSRMRGRRAFVLLSIYLAILGVVTLLLYAAMVESMGSDLNAGRQIGKALFLTIATVALIEVCVLTPALTAGSIAGEKERQTYDLLIASLLTPWQIVWGKLAAALAFMLLLIFAALPLMSLAFLFGGVSPAEVLIALVGLVATAVFYAAIGLFWSSALRSSLGATSFALGSIILMLIGIPFLAVIFSVIFGARMPTDWLSSVLVIYVGGAFLVTHPFIALGLTEASLSSGAGPFVTKLTVHSYDIFIPSPWLAYVLLVGLLSALLIWLSVGMVRPTSETHERAAPRGAGDAEG